MNSPVAWKNNLCEKQYLLGLGQNLKLMFKASVLADYFD